MSEEEKQVEKNVEDEVKNDVASEEVGAEEKSDEIPVEEPAVAEPTAEERCKAAEEQVLRVRAEFDNYRKRMAKEAAETRERAKVNVISALLPVYDYFQMAMASASQTQDFKILKQGMDMILAEFTRAFDALGLKEISAVGQPFDPRLHEAAKTESSELIPEGTVLSQWKTGYRLGELLVRPSMVVVSSGPEKEEPPAAETAAAQEESQADAPEHSEAENNEKA